MAADELNLVRIEAVDDPRVSDYANLKDAQLRALREGSGEAGVFLAEGDLVVRQLVESGLRVRSVFLTPERLEALRGDLSRLPAGVPVYVAEPAVMVSVVGFNIHRGVLAAGDRPQEPELGRLLESARTLVVLEDLANHDNVGGIFRATAALAGLPEGGRGGGAVLLSPRCCDPLYRKSIRVSMGMALRVPFARLDPWPGGLERVRAAGFRVVALTPDPGAVPIGELRREAGERVALLLGAEGPGLSGAAMGAADVRVRIPISGAVDSLNVVVAAGIGLASLAGEALD